MAEQQTEARRARGSRREFFLLGLAVVALIIGAVGYYIIQTTTGHEEDWVSEARQLSTGVTDIAKLGSDVTHGVAPDFLTLSSSAEDFDSTVKALAEGDSSTPPAPSGAQSEVAAVSTAWKQMKQTVDSVLAGEQKFERSTQNVATVVGGIHSGEGDLYSNYEQIAERLAQKGAAAGVIYIAAGQLIRLERLSSAAQRLLSQGRDAQATAELLAKESKAFQRNNDSLASDPNVSALVRTAQEKFAPIATAIEQVQQDAPAIDQMQVAAAQLQGASTNVIATSNLLEQKLLDSRVRQVILPKVVTGSFVVALLALAGFIVLFFLGFRDRVQRAEDRDARQQQAILGLLDEITNLADGDLTVDVTVTEDFTGAIADSINYTVANMRNLVGTITNTSVEIAAAASSTQQTAVRMNEASERQAREIAAVTNTIAATSQSMQQVAARAEQLAQQAQDSVQIAHNGAQTVGRTIQGMASLREQIQDTSKRIKRLGESSQEIGNIIEFINDIAEQTNTLALNASIQAAMAGEAGRGFAVVADEVQRLAERAGTATRQIENLVKTIQADTNEAIISMERSTQNVVVGAKSAEEAGQALTKIETSSQELAKLIQEISTSARNQSASATKIAGTMQIIRDIAIQTSGSAAQTAQAVGELTNLSEKLRASVSGFKLPADITA
jgi:twitching motility protein PilJ